jgi:hypothetical protein
MPIILSLKLLFEQEREKAFAVTNRVHTSDKRGPSNSELRDHFSKRCSLVLCQLKFVHLDIISRSSNMNTNHNEKALNF